MRELAELVAQVGFPIVVALYLLIRLDYLMRKMTEALGGLAKVVAMLTGRMKE